MALKNVKKETRSLATIADIKVVKTKELKYTPASVQQTSSEQYKVETPAFMKEMLKGAKLEVVDVSFPPSVVWEKFGNQAGGLYKASQEEVGPNKQTLYTFEYKKKEFAIWGTTMIDKIMALVSIGDLVCLTYTHDLETDQEPCKMFHCEKATPA